MYLDFELNAAVRECWNINWKLARDLSPNNNCKHWTAIHPATLTVCVHVLRLPSLNCVHKWRINKLLFGGWEKGERKNAEETKNHKNISAKEQVDFGGWFLYASEINGTVYCKWFCLGCGGGCRFPNRQQHLIEGSFIVGYCRCMTTPPFRWQFYYFTLVEQTGGAITRGPQQPTVTRRERFLPSPISGRRWIIIVGSSLCQEREALKLNGSSLDEMSEWWCCRLLGNILSLGRVVDEWNSMLLACADGWRKLKWNLWPRINSQRL